MQPFFLLMPGWWSGFDDHLCAPLVGRRDTQNPHVPWLVVARGAAGHTPELVRIAGLNRAGAEALVTAADRWLAHTRAWHALSGAATRGARIFSVATPSAAGMLTDPTNDLACEQVANELALVEGHLQFSLDTALLAIIARRGQLLVAPFEPTSAADIRELAAASYARAPEADRLTPCPLIIREHRIVGYIAPNGDVCYPTSTQRDWNIPFDAPLPLPRAIPWQLFP